MMLLIRHKLSVKDFSIDWIAAAFGLAMTNRSIHGERSVAIHHSDRHNSNLVPFLYLAKGLRRRGGRVGAA